MSALQYAPWSSDIELSFYAALASRKINTDKLDDAARKVVGRYELRPMEAPERSSRMQIHANAFATNEVSSGFLRAEGMLKNVNTIEEYKNLDRAAIIEQAGKGIWDAILDGSIYSAPSLLSSFYAIFFADLKKYRFTYHFAFPALHSDPQWKISAEVPRKLDENDSNTLVNAVQSWRDSVDQTQHGFFLAKRTSMRTTRINPSEVPAPAISPEQYSTASLGVAETGFQWTINALSSYEKGFFEGVDPEDSFVCFTDPSTYPENPGWMLRNLLVLVRQRWQLKDVQILCYRDTHARRDLQKSIILNLISETLGELNLSSSQPTMPKVTGWERNEKSKINSKMVDLAEYMDPSKLADQSVDLNLKLMKWRIAPDLDLDLIKNTKCLLLGAGTLGSYVSRNLLGWGVRKITFVDNGKVSFSNPVRQPLFSFKDCIDGGAAKATRAADMLHEIYPGVDSVGHVMSVPMAGHPITDEAKVKKDFELLQKLFEEHDAIFLLMDTRESRWLPTVMGKAAGKIVVNAALGFDTYVVMRHGIETSHGIVPPSISLPEGTIEPQKLGCYFCNDVVAPADSVKDQTLDQQCTVTRPGIAAIASALLVELLVSILQHPLGPAAPAPGTRAAPRSPLNHPLGLVPHQIRGYLSTFDNMLIHGPSYDCCSACSPKIVQAYDTEGWDFVQKALNEPGYVEDLSGLAEVQRRAEEASNDVDWDDEDDQIPDVEEEGEML